jgi:F-type H+-transporting ATPase subunit epsilon
MSAFTVNILTPEKKIVEDLAADSLLIPTTTGQINVLEGHTHIITLLDTGVLTVFTGKQERKFCMTTGTVKILGSDVVILAKVSEDEKSIDLQRAEKAKTTAQSKLNSSEITQDEIVKYQRKLARAQIRIELAKNLK